VINNIYPIVRPDNPNAYGHQEVVIDTPQHNVDFADLSIDHIATVLGVFGKRIRALEKDPKISHILAFKNHGGKAGASIAHAHSQIFASSFLPPHIIDKRRRAEGYRIQKGRCYYEDLIVREQRGPRWVTEDDHFMVFCPYASSYNYEAWVIPWRHVDNISNLSNTELYSLAEHTKRLLIRLEQIGLSYNLYAHQVVRDKNEHFYFRIAPRGDVWAGLELGSRLIVNTVPPEDAAKFYRGSTKQKPKHRFLPKA
jgi:UDPglucose--hexose-1-phosphate uridylyltransferase